MADDYNEKWDQAHKRNFSLYEKLWYIVAEVASVMMLVGGWLVADVHWFGYFLITVGAGYTVGIGMSYYLFQVTK